MYRARSICAVLLAFVAAPGACAANHIDENLQTLEIQSASDSVPLRRGSDATSFAVEVLMRNRGPRALIVGSCGGPEAQRKIDGEWQTVWSPVCVSDQGTLVAPRSSATRTLSVVGFTRLGIEPRLDPRMTAGVYRLRYVVSVPDSSTGTTSGQRVPVAYPRSGKSLGFIVSQPFVVYGPSR
jgi:hypothetical protein